MADELDCRIVAMLALALSMLSLTGVIFVRHHHHAYYHSPEAFSTDSDIKSDSGTSHDENGSGSENSSPTNLIASAQYESNETSPHSDANRGVFDVSEACLHCICEAATECKPAKCSNGFECGIFRIYQPYWIDAGSPTLEGGIYEKHSGINSEMAYSECVKNPFCSARAVKNYMRRYARDCDGDGTIDCYDYAALHVQGPSGCNLDELSQRMFARLYRCLGDFRVKSRRSVSVDGR